MNLHRVCLFVVLSAACSIAGASDRKFILKPRPAANVALPYSEGVLVGTTLYIAGHFGLDFKTNEPPASAQDEARLAMDGIKRTVESAGLTMEDVVSMQVFCTDLNLYDTFNRVYRTYFHGDFPARAFLGTNKLLFNGRFEVMGIAIKRAK